MKIGDPLDRSTDHGPQNHKAHMDKLLEYCEVGVKEGATLVYGGKQVDRPGRIRTGASCPGQVCRQSTRGCDEDQLRGGVVSSVLVGRLTPGCNLQFSFQGSSWSQLCSLMWRTTCSSPKKSPLALSWWCPSSKMGKSSKKESHRHCGRAVTPVQLPTRRSTGMWKACCREPTTQSTVWLRACSPATSTRPCM